MGKTHDDIPRIEMLDEPIISFEKVIDGFYGFLKALGVIAAFCIALWAMGSARDAYKQRTPGEIRCDLAKEKK